MPGWRQTKGWETKSRQIKSCVFVSDATRLLDLSNTENQFDRITIEVGANWQTDFMATSMVMLTKPADKNMCTIRVIWTVCWVVRRLQASDSGRALSISIINKDENGFGERAPQSSAVSEHPADNTLLK